ncbi:14688_t:CDS:2 [Ambispora leptoticha]|uniref:14688_t:CDS:1 n=1 Tax=Ambispora leptoticha TaxID=144679 RepID=A0A9N8VEE7_9GLOM|nr:14688_t:CDS:2 [Ambispora leptoticha]
MLVNHKIILLLDFFIASVFACTPNNFDGNSIAISLTGTTKNWRVNLGGSLVQAGVQLIIFNNGNQPDRNDIFTIASTTPGIFEISPYINFYHNLVIAQAPNSKIGDNFTLQNRTISPENINFINSQLNPNLTVTTSPSTSTSDMGQSSGVQLSIGGLGICFSVTVSLSLVTIESTLKFTNNGGGYDASISRQSEIDLWYI